MNKPSRARVCTDDELEEIDVVSVTSCDWSDMQLDLQTPPPVARRSQQVLVLPAAESMSAQVAAMHNYSNPRVQRPPLQTTSAAAAAQRSTATFRSTTSSHVPLPSSCSAKYERRCVRSGLCDSDNLFRPISLKSSIVEKVKVKR